MEIAATDNEINEDFLFESILQSMGIEKYDQYALAAVIEYARRKKSIIKHIFSPNFIITTVCKCNVEGITTEIVCDAKDFANHAGKEDVSSKMSCSIV